MQMHTAWYRFQGSAELGHTSSAKESTNVSIAPMLMLSFWFLFPMVVVVTTSIVLPKVPFSYQLINHTHTHSHTLCLVQYFFLFQVWLFGIITISQVPEVQGCSKCRTSRPPQYCTSCMSRLLFFFCICFFFFLVILHLFESRIPLFISHKPSKSLNLQISTLHHLVGESLSLQRNVQAHSHTVMPFTQDACEECHEVCQEQYPA